MVYPGVFDAWHRYSLCNSHTPGWWRTWCYPLGKCAEMVYSIILPLIILTLISLLLIRLCGLVWFYAYKCHICLPISALWEWWIILTLFAQLTYVNVLHWIVGLYYYGFLVIEGIGLILVIQTFYPSTISVLHNKDVYPTSPIVWSSTFPFDILKSH